MYSFRAVRAGVLHGRRKRRLAHAGQKIDGDVPVR